MIEVELATIVHVISSGMDVRRSLFVRRENVQKLESFKLNSPSNRPSVANATGKPALLNDMWSDPHDEPQPVKAHGIGMYVSTSCVAKDVRFKSTWLSKNPMMGFVPFFTNAVTIGMREFG